MTNGISKKIFALFQFMHEKNRSEPILKKLPNGDKEWRLNGELHREDGPAVERADGSKAWYLHDNLHREDGPAIEWENRTKAWYLNGKQYTEEVYVMIQLMNGNNIYA